MLEMDTVYSVSMFKINEGVSDEYCMSVVTEFASMWIKATGCKKITILGNIYLPWPSAEIKYDYDYIVVAVWDKADVIKFEEAGGLNSPAVQAMMEEIRQDLALDIQHVSTNFTTFGYFQVTDQVAE